VGTQADKRTLTIVAGDRRMTVTIGEQMTVWNLKQYLADLTGAERDDGWSVVLSSYVRDFCSPFPSQALARVEYMQLEHGIMILPTNSAAI
jgi:hypothetical protein